MLGEGRVVITRLEVPGYFRKMIATMSDCRSHFSGWLRWCWKRNPVQLLSDLNIIVIVKKTIFRCENSPEIVRILSLIEIGTMNWTVELRSVFCLYLLTKAHFRRRSKQKTPALPIVRAPSENGLFTFRLFRSDKSCFEILRAAPRHPKYPGT